MIAAQAMIGRELLTGEDCAAGDEVDVRVTAHTGLVGVVHVGGRRHPVAVERREIHAIDQGAEIEVNAAQLDVGEGRNDGRWNPGRIGGVAGERVGAWWDLADRENADAFAGRCLQPRVEIAMRVRSLRRGGLSFGEKGNVPVSRRAVRFGESRTVSLTAGLVKGYGRRPARAERPG